MMQNMRLCAFLDGYFVHVGRWVGIIRWLQLRIIRFQFWLAGKPLFRITVLLMRSVRPQLSKMSPFSASPFVAWVWGLQFFCTPVRFHCFRQTHSTQQKKATNQSSLAVVNSNGLSSGGVELSKTATKEHKRTIPHENAV